jgi:hypothetical protein
MVAIPKTMRNKEMDMKYAVMTFLIFVSSLSGVNLINESFSSFPAFPAGWTKAGQDTTVWYMSNTTYAGGSSGELRFNYNPSASGTYRYISPAFDTRKVHDMSLSFKYMLDDYEGSSQTYNLEMQISPNGTNWTTIWAVTAGAEDIPATSVTTDINYALGMSATTYLAVTFIGNNFNLNNWFVDDIVLSYTNTLGSGTWDTGTHYPQGDVIVPANVTFSLNPGTTLRFANSQSLRVNGNLQSIGTSGSPVILTSLNASSSWNGVKILNTINTQDSTRISFNTISFSQEKGITISNSNKIRVSNCDIAGNYGYSGGGLTLTQTNAILENNLIRGNDCYAYGTALYCAQSTATIRNNVIRENKIRSGVVYLLQYDTNRFTGNTIVQNGGTSTWYRTLWLSNCTGTLSRQLIANNDGIGIYVDGTAGSGPTIQNCLIVNNYHIGVYNEGNLTLNSSIIWGNHSYSMYNSRPSLVVKYCDIQGGVAGITGTTVSPQNYISNIDSDPLFVDPTPSYGDGYDPTTRNWNLQLTSPCIDAGDPDLPVDIDLSVVDIGMYSLNLRPVITRLADVIPDQGRQLDLNWNRAPFDTGYQPQRLYSVWRQEITREETHWLQAPQTLQDALNSREENIAWRDGDRIWYYIAQVPAVDLDAYGMIVPTIQDSSSTGNHAVQYMVMFHDGTDLWRSMPWTAYSVDNIPPAAARDLELQPMAAEQMVLSWDEVSEGLWEGNSYPEINTISYKVYGGSTPDFTIGPSSLMGSTLDTQFLLNSAAECQFFRIVVSDSE